MDDIMDTFKEVMGYDLPTRMNDPATDLPVDGVDVELPTRDRVKEIELPKGITIGTRTGRWPSAASGGHARSHTVYTKKYIAVTGDLSAGFKFYGPFENAAFANGWADANLKDGDPYRVYLLNEVKS